MPTEPTQAQQGIDTPRRFALARLDSLPPIACPCGWTRRAFADLPSSPASVHLVDIGRTARTHYHRKMTETYVVLSGEGIIELDGERVPLVPMTAVMIAPGCRHRAIGDLRILNIAVPAFDPADEWFD